MLNLNIISINPIFHVKQKIIQNRGCKVDTKTKKKCIENIQREIPGVELI